MTHAARCAVLAAFFLAITEQLSLANLALALGVGGVSAWVWSRGSERVPGAPVLGRILLAPWLVAGFVLLLVRGAVTTLRAFAKRGRNTPTRTVEVRVGERTEIGADLSALLASSAPGSILDEATDETMRFDELGSDPERARDAHQRFYERFQRKVRP